MAKLSDTKTCRDCGETKELCEYRKDPYKPLGRENRCKLCTRNRYAARTPDSAIVAQRARIARGEKLCSRCRAVLPLANFYRLRGRKPYSSMCRRCSAAAQRERKGLGTRTSRNEIVELMRLGIKRCGRCKLELPRSSFHKNTKKRDGLQSSCRECTSEVGMAAYRRDIEKSRARRREATRRYAKKNPKKGSHPHAHAHAAVMKAVKSGRLVRPDVCEQCRKSESRIEAHHDDYSKPLDVRWLCAACHKIAHALHANEPELLKNTKRTPSALLREKKTG